MIIGNLQNGYVIDHIPAGRGMELYSLLKLDRLDCEIALIMNAPSEKYGRKDILKVAETEGLDFSILGYIDQNITVNRIENGEKMGKFHPRLPRVITDLIKCRNPRCITTTEQELQQVFLLSDEEKHTYRCRYCQTAAK